MEDQQETANTYEQWSCTMSVYIRAIAGKGGFTVPLLFTFKVAPVIGRPPGTAPAQLPDTIDTCAAEER